MLLGGYLERGADEAARIIGLRVGEDVGHGALFDDLAMLHHHDAVAEGAMEQLARLLLSQAAVGRPT